MIAYVIRRVLQAVPLLLLISLVGFVLIQATGDPIAAYTVDASLTSEDIARLKAKYGLDKPVPVQYLNWLKNMLAGDWGYSYHTNEPVRDMVFDRLPNTLLISAVSGVLILVVGLGLGVLTAVHQYSLFDHVVTGLSFVGISMPSFWLGLMLIYGFAVRFKRLGFPHLPVGGMADPAIGPTPYQVATHAVLPAVTLSVVVAARYVRYIRAEVLEELHSDYVATARSKGLPERVVLWIHVFKNVLPAALTLIALDIPSFLSGTIVIESVFAWPGMGRLFWSAAERTDIPVLMSTLLLVSTITVVSNLLADVLYAVVDPRVRYN